MINVLLCLLFGFSLNAQTNSKPNPAFEDKVQTWLNEFDVPAVGIGIIENGKLQYLKVFGELKSGVPAPDNTIFSVASMTKPVVAILTLKLVEAAQWDLDEPLYHYWVDPDVVSDPLHKKLTTRHILSHQTGFVNWRRNHSTGKLTFDYEPGTKYGYSGEGFEYLRRALEEKFNKSLVELSDSILFKPLGMRNTRYYWDENMDESRFAYWHDNYGNIHRRSTPRENGIREVNSAGSLLTTVEDYCKFGIHVMNGAGLSEGLFNDMVSSQVKLGEHHYQGLSWFVVKDLPNEEYALQHAGSNPGVKTIGFFLPKSKRGVVVFTNGDNGLAVFMNVVGESFDIGKILLDNMFKSSNLPDKATLTNEVLIGYVGTYLDQFGNNIIITKEGSALKIKGGNYSGFCLLYAEKEDKFFMEYFEIKFEFVRDDSGNVIELIHIQDGKISNTAKKIKGD